MFYCKETDIYYLNNYHCYRIYGNKNPHFNNKTGGYILNVKNNIEPGISYYAKTLFDNIKDTDFRDFNLITIVPSSTQNKVSEGLSQIASFLAKNCNDMKLKICLNRDVTVEKKSHGGIRDKDIEMQTISVINKSDILNKTIILLDDVTTTGVSLSACKEILIKNGALKVICIALGKTVYEKRRLHMNNVLLLTLLNIPQLSKKVIWSLYEKNGPEAFNFDNIDNLLIQAKSINKKISIPTDNDINGYKDRAEEIIESSKSYGIKMINILDNDYPDKLKNIEDPPIILYYKGNKQCLLQHKSVAIVGTRNPTSYGMKIAERLGYIFGEDNYVVVSGLAKGCDEWGHKGCVDAHGRSIAVLPGGLDNIYPPSNTCLASSILDNGGCLVSEYRVGKKPFRNTFIERDRLQSALSMAVIVVETNIKGGTMHTVGFTIKNDKILACFNHPEKYRDNKNTKGNQMLIENGKALGFYSKEDINKLKNMIEDKINVINNQDKIEKIQEPTFFNMV